MIRPIIIVLLLYAVAICAYADRPQFLWGNPYFFCENLYQSVSIGVASMYREIFHAIRVATQFAKKIRHCVDASNPNRQIEVYSVVPN